MKKAYGITIVVSILLVVFAGAGVFAYRHFSKTSYPQVLSAVSFSLYYPSKLPEGWIVKPDTLKAGSSQASFVIYNPVTKTELLIIEQAATDSFEDGLGEAMKNATSFSTPDGVGKIGEINSAPNAVPSNIDKTLPKTKYAFLQTNSGTLIQASAGDISSIQLELILKSFVKQK